MRDIRVSPDVEALVGAEELRRLHGEPFARYTCWRCGRPGQSTDPAAVIVERYRSADVVHFAHAGCAESQVILVDADRPGSGILADIRARAVVMAYPTPPGYRALLVLEPRVEISEPAGSGDQVNLWVSGLLEQGLTLIQAGGQMPGRAGGWRLIIHDEGNAELLDPRGAVVYEGGCSTWPDWHDVVAEINGCVVLIGTIGLYAVCDEDMTTGRFAHLLNQAAKAGVLAGGLVEVERR